MASARFGATERLEGESRSLLFGSFDPRRRALVAEIKAGRRQQGQHQHQTDVEAARGVKMADHALDRLHGDLHQAMAEGTFGCTRPPADSTSAAAARVSEGLGQTPIVAETAVSGAVAADEATST